jgi:hypothetical protein
VRTIVAVSTGSLTWTPDRDSILTGIQLTTSKADEATAFGAISYVPDISLNALINFAGGPSVTDEFLLILHPAVPMFLLNFPIISKRMLYFFLVGAGAGVFSFFLQDISAEQADQFS